MSSTISEDIKWLWNEGSYNRAYELLGAHLTEEKGKKGVRFTVWAPEAFRVSVVGEFNNWDGRRNIMEEDEKTGLWTTFVPGVEHWALYKYELKTARDAPPFLKSDPYAFCTELRPKNASLVYDIDTYRWQDKQWMQTRDRFQQYDQPVSIYEVHLGSWKRKGQKEEYLTYRELADELVDYVDSMGFSHVELMPVSEHPYDPSWGYQVTGYFAPTRRFGEPKDFMCLVDKFHQKGIGVIMDWVPGHFPKDEEGLQMFDGSPLYEHEDPKRREQKDWGTHIFDYGKAGVRNFLLSNAIFWCEKYHIDGLRVDAVASMLYLDYSKEDGEWTPNKYGGNEHLEAIDFLRQFNEALNKNYPGVSSIAEESTSWPGVTQPSEYGGLGFDYKWNMGWMNDTLSYYEKDPWGRINQPDKITFPMVYAMHEKFILPLSHDEVVHLKKPLLLKSPGTMEEKHSNLRLLFTYMFGIPGKKLLFMGGEFGQTSEWTESGSLDWHLLKKSPHRGVKKLFDDLLTLYTNEKALYELDHNAEGFEWIDLGKKHSALFSFLRKASDPANHLLFVVNFSDQWIEGYKPAAFRGETYKLVFESESQKYGGSFESRIEVVDGTQMIDKVPPFSGLIAKPRSRL